MRLWRALPLTSFVTLVVLAGACVLNPQPQPPDQAGGDVDSSTTNGGNDAALGADSGKGTDSGSNPDGGGVIDAGDAGTGDAASDAASDGPIDAPDEGG